MMNGWREEKEKEGKTSGTSDRFQRMEEKVSILGNVFIHEYSYTNCILLPFGITIEQTIF